MGLNNQDVQTGLKNIEKIKREQQLAVLKSRKNYADTQIKIIENCTNDQMISLLVKKLHDSVTFNDFHPEILAMYGIDKDNYPEANAFPLVDTIIADLEISIETPHQHEHQPKNLEDRRAMQSEGSLQGLINHEETKTLKDELFAKKLPELTEEITEEIAKLPKMALNILTARSGFLNLFPNSRKQD